MRLFAYYALHTFKNQIKKLFKTWVLIFLVVCFVIGIVFGVFAAFLDDSAEEKEPDLPEPTVTAQEMLPSDGAASALEGEESAFFETTGIGTSDALQPTDLIELFAGWIVLAMLVLYAMNADKNGSRIFLPADVNLLFPSPMKPQSVLLFRLATQVGIAILGSVYMLIQLPNLVLNANLTGWAALSLVAAWGMTIVFCTLIQVLLYTLSSTYPVIKRFLRPVLYGILLLTAAGFVLFAAQPEQAGQGYLLSAARFFNAKITRFLPVWGWIKGFCAYAMEGSLPGALLCLLALGLGGALLIYIIWHIKADFYEDAMAKSEETAALLEKAQSEKSTGFLVARKKERSDHLRRNELRHGAGANVFFFKALYNRFRFAHLGFFTKTMELYLAASVGISLFCRFVTHTEGILPIALTLAGLAFFRSLGNPLEQDTKMDFFRLIPESTWAKLFWSLMGGTANCLLDVLPAILVGALLTGTNLFLALAWVPFIVSVDFYATNVGSFIGLSVPVAAGKMVKQIVQVMFVYFGLLPDIAVIALGAVFDFMIFGLIGAALLNFGLGFLFFGLSPLFLDQTGARKTQSAAPFHGDPRLAKRQFSRIGFALFTMVTAASVLQLVTFGLVGKFYPEGQGPSWLLWLCTFAPLYLAAVPLGLLILKRAPASPPEKHSLKPGQFASAALISIFLMYAGNLAGTLLLSLIQAAGLSSENPLLLYAMDDSLVLRILVMVLVAPVIEEILFRKQLIDRMNVYGEKLAVVTSAFLFGLFHGNLSQFCYTFALGLPLGYLYLKTGRLRYTIAIHMLVNFLGSVLVPALLSRIPFDLLAYADLTDETALKAFLPQLLPFAIYVLALIGICLAGLVLFCIHVRRIRFQTAELELTKGWKLKTVYLNGGMALFVASALLLFALTLLA